MPRPRTFTDEELEEAYKLSNDMPEIAARLGTSPITVYKHCKRVGLPPIGVNNIAQSLRVYESYRGRKSIEDLAREERVSIPSVRSNLMRAVAYKWLGAGKHKVPRHPNGSEAAILDRHTKVPIYPRPRRVQYIKIIHELEKQPELLGDPIALHQLTNVPIFKINVYLEEHHFKQTLKNRNRKAKGNRKEQLVAPVSSL